MPKPKVYDEEDSDISTEDLLKSIQETPESKNKKKKPETIREHTKESGGMVGYFSKRKKIMKELED